MRCRGGHAAGHDDHLHLWFEDEQESVPRVLRNFTKGDDVTRLQEKLIAAGFPIDEFTRHCLLEGLDDIGLTLQHQAEISAYESRHPVPTAWRS